MKLLRRITHRSSSPLLAIARKKPLGEKRKIFLGAQIGAGLDHVLLSISHRKRDDAEADETKGGSEIRPVPSHGDYQS